MGIRAHDGSPLLGVNIVNRGLTGRQKPYPPRTSGTANIVGESGVGEQDKRQKHSLVVVCG